MTQKNYDCGRAISSYEQAWFPSETNFITDAKAKRLPICFNPKQLKFPIENPSLIYIDCRARYNRVIEKFEKNNQLFLDICERIQICGLILIPTPIYKNYLFRQEEITAHIRRILDALVQVTVLITDSEQHMDKDKTKIKLDSVGKCLREGNNSLVGAIINGGQHDGGQHGKFNFAKDDTDYLTVINDISNCFKHSLHQLINPLLGSDPNNPSLIALDKKNNPIFNCSFYHIIMGFQDTITRISKNQMQYWSNKNDK